MSRGGDSRPHIVATEKEDVVLFIGRRQEALQFITQPLVGDIGHFLIEVLLAPLDKQQNLNHVTLDGKKNPLM